MRKKRLLTGMLAAVLSVSMICSNLNTVQAQEATQTSEVVTETVDKIIPNDETGIPDKKLYEIILADVDGNGDGVLTVSEAEQMYEVFGEGAGIKDLTGLEYCPNIFCLYLDDNEIEDISVLKNFTKMSELCLANNKISDISVLKDFKISVGLGLANNQISDIRALENLKGDFYYLDLSDNQITDISVLNEELTPTILDLSNNQITDISSLKHITDGWGILLSNNKITDISVLNENLELHNLELANNEITDITALSTMTISAMLDLSNNKISDIRALGSFQTGEMDLSHNKISDLSVLRPEFWVNELNLANNEIQDVTPLANARIESTLDLSNNHIEDFSSLDGLKEKGCDITFGEQSAPEVPSEPETPGQPEIPSEPDVPVEPEDILSDLEARIPDKNLYKAVMEAADSNKDGRISVSESQEYIEIHGESAGIKDLTGLELFPKIYCLYLDNNEIKDISVLKNFTKMSEICLRNNQIEDISALANVNITVGLGLSGNKISDIRALSHLKDLFYMDLAGNKISDISVLNAEFDVSDLNLSDNQIKDISFLGKFDSLCCVDLSNNKISDISVLHPELWVNNLNLANNRIKDVAPLANMQINSTLDLSNNRIHDISALAALIEKGCEVTTDGNPIGEPEDTVIKLEDEVISEKAEEISKTEAGQTIVVDMATEDGEVATVVPVEILNAAKGKDINVILDMGGYSWMIHGKDIKAQELSAVNLEVTFNTNAIPADSVHALADGAPAIQLSLTHNGDFGFKASLNVNAGSGYEGKFANLYYYDNMGKLVFMNAGKIDAEGKACVVFSHASDYVIVIDEDRTLQETDETAKDTVSSPDTGYAVLVDMLGVIMILAGVFTVLCVKNSKKAY